MEEVNRVQKVFVEPTWITGETCLFRISNPFEYAQAKAKLTKIRQEFISRLEKEGFIITYDKNDEEAVCLIMNDLAVCDYNTDDKEYKKEYDNKIFEAGGDLLNYPYSLSMEEYFETPFFPAVFKNESQNAGIDKFLIENVEQLEIIKKFYKDFLDKKEYVYTFKNCIFQQLIQTPTNYKTYMRLLMSASGDVLGASLKYSKNVESQNSNQGMFEPYFLNPQSEYYLNCKKMFNYYSGGENIFFPQPKYSSEKQSILKAHDIDPNNPEIPSEVLEVSSAIAKKCNRQLGIICGIDFIYNEIDRKWYYLELQAFPAIEEWANRKDIRVKKEGKNIDDYIKYLTLELEVRYEALMMYMTKKQEEEKIRKLV